MTEAEDLTAGADDIAGRTKRGLLWRFAAFGIGGVLEVVVSIILARLLMPEDFGIIAIVYLLLGFVGWFNTLGLPAALVQRKVLDEGHKSAAFWTSAIMGLLFASAVFLSADLAAGFFEEPEAAPVMRVLSLVTLLLAVKSIPDRMLQRDMSFRKMFWVEVAGRVAYGLIGIPMALTGFGVWSLAAARLAQALVATGVAYAMYPYWPRAGLDLSAARDLLSFGAGMTSAQVLQWFTGNVDYIIIGRYMPSEALGIYKKAYEWPMYPVSKLVGPAQAVLFPAFARIQSEPRRAQYALERTLSGLGVLSLPFLAILCVLAPEFIPTVFGEQWQEAVVPTQILAGVGMISVVSGPLGSMADALGYASGRAVCNLAYLAILVPGLLFAVQYDLVAIAWVVVGAATVQLISRVVLLRIARGWGIRVCLSALRLPILLGASAALVSGTISILLRGTQMGPVGILVIAGGAAMLAATSIVFWGPWPEGRKVLGDMWFDLRRRLSPLSSGL